jgi:chromosome segregation ATPase
MDYSKAADWYQRAARKKFAPAMQELGYLYEQGLGVRQDPLAGLNLQREASGLGEDLDYAWKIAATREQADEQIAGLTEQLAGTNAVVRDLRMQLQVRDARLLQGRAQLTKDRQQLAQLRVELERTASASGDSGVSAARMQELQQKLAIDQSALTDKQREIDGLSASLSTQQAQLAEQLARSQATNSKLNELLTSGRAANEGLRANAAQMELRLNQAQAELSTLRTSYLKETNELAARSEELQQLREHGGDAAQALVSAKQRELDQQRAQNQQLQSQAHGDKDAHDGTLALTAQLSAKLTAKTQELEEQQRRISAMQTETDRLRDEYARAREAGNRQTVTISGQAQQEREALRLAQEEIARQSDRMEHLEVEVAARKLELVKLRENLTREAAGGRGTREGQAAVGPARRHSQGG